MHSKTKKIIFRCEAVQNEAYLNILETFSINSWGLKALESMVSAPITELMAERNPVRNSIRLIR